MILPSQKTDGQQITGGMSLGRSRAFNYRGRGENVAKRLSATHSRGL